MSRYEGFGLLFKMIPIVKRIQTERQKKKEIKERQVIIREYAIKTQDGGISVSSASHSQKQHIELLLSTLHTSAEFSEFNESRTRGDVEVLIVPAEFLNRNIPLMRRVITNVFSRECGLRKKEAMLIITCYVSSESQTTKRTSLDQVEITIIATQQSIANYIKGLANHPRTQIEKSLEDLTHQDKSLLLPADKRDGRINVHNHTRPDNPRLVIYANDSFGGSVKENAIINIK